MERIFSHYGTFQPPSRFCRIRDVRTPVPFVFSSTNRPLEGRYSTFRPSQILPRAVMVTWTVVPRLLAGTIANSDQGPKI